MRSDGTPPYSYTTAAQKHDMRDIDGMRVRVRFHVDCVERKTRERVRLVRANVGTVEHRRYSESKENNINTDSSQRTRREAKWNGCIMSVSSIEDKRWKVVKRCKFWGIKICILS